SSKKEETVSDLPDELAVAPFYKVDQSFKSQIGDVFTSYIALKESFVAADQKKIKEDAADLKQTLSAVDMTLVTGDAHNAWMEYLHGIDGALMEIQGTDDIEAQRGAFSMLTDNLYQSVKAFGITVASSVYYPYCPMAFNDNGAYWLSNTEVIPTPYIADYVLSLGK